MNKLTGLLTKPLTFLLMNFCLVAGSQAVVIRHDVDDKLYREIQHPVSGMATIYVDGGHGVLIKPQWVLTVAHATFCLKPGRWIKVGDKLVQIEGLYNHPDYRPQNTHDIALIKLTEPQDIAINTYINKKGDENGAHYFFMGLGGTGVGTVGQTVTGYDNAGVYREAENRVDRAEGFLIYSRFDKGDEGLPLEGSPGEGDSGTPIYRVDEKGLEILGLASRSERPFLPVGRYGTVDIYTRISPLAGWIESITNSAKPGTQFYKPESGYLPFGVSRGELPEICADINFQSATSKK